MIIFGLSILQHFFPPLGVPFQYLHSEMIESGPFVGEKANQKYAVLARSGTPRNS